MSDIIFIKPKKINLQQYKVIEERIDGYAYRSLNGLVIISSIAKEADGRQWLHVSFSRKNRMPEYKDIQTVKRDFIGEEYKAIMVFPEKKHYVNMHKYCLHLFSCVSHDSPIPEFSKGGLL